MKHQFNQTAPRLESLLGRQTLLLGEINSGKTVFSFLFLQYLLQSYVYRPCEISVLDFGPPRLNTGSTSIGGTFQELLDSTLHLDDVAPSLSQVHWVAQESLEGSLQSSPVILAPRYSSKTSQSVLQACCQNFKATFRQVKHFLNHPTPALIINDIGIYLHVGGLNLLKKAIGASQTTLLNAYYGRSLVQDYGSNISRREQIVLQLLMKHMNTYLCTDFLELMSFP